MKSHGPLPPAYLLLSLVAMVVLHLSFPGAKLLAWPWNLLGAVPLAFGIVLNLAADRDFKRLHTTVKPFEEPSSLATEGVFGLTRNPMYLGMASILLGFGLLLGSATPLALVPAFSFLMDRRFIYMEERMLEERFGDEWLAYKSTVRKWI